MAEPNIITIPTAPIELGLAETQASLGLLQRAGEAVQQGIDHVRGGIERGYRNRLLRVGLAMGTLLPTTTAAVEFIDTAPASAAASTQCYNTEVVVNFDGPQPPEKTTITWTLGSQSETYTYDPKGDPGGRPGRSWHTGSKGPYGPVRASMTYGDHYADWSQTVSYDKECTSSTTQPPNPGTTVATQPTPNTTPATTAPNRPPTTRRAVPPATATTRRQAPASTATPNTTAAPPSTEATTTSTEASTTTTTDAQTGAVANNNDSGEAQPPTLSESKSDQTGERVIEGTMLAILIAMGAIANHLRRHGRRGPEKKAPQPV